MQAEDDNNDKTTHLSVETRRAADSMLAARNGAAATLVDSALGALKHGSKDGKPRLNQCHTALFSLMHKQIASRDEALMWSARRKGYDCIPVFSSPKDRKSHRTQDTQLRHIAQCSSGT